MGFIGEEVIFPPIEIITAYAPLFGFGSTADWLECLRGYSN